MARNAAKHTPCLFDGNYSAHPHFARFWRQKCSQTGSMLRAFSLPANKMQAISTVTLLTGAE